MSRRKNTRMIPRAQRRADAEARAAALAALTPEQRDALAIRAAGLDPSASAPVLAEAWLGFIDEPGQLLPATLEDEVVAALGRQLERLEGRPITHDAAEAIVDYDPRDYCAEVDL